MTSEDQLIGKKLKMFSAKNFWIQLLDLLVFNVCFWKMALCHWNAPLHHALYPPHQRFAWLYSLEVYQIQSIRIVSETIIKLLTNQGVDFQYETTINDIQVDIKGATKVARRLLLTQAGKTKEIPLTENDLVFVTNGSITESSTQGDHHTPAPITHELGEVGISGKT